MNYYVLFTIRIPETKFYIEVGLDYKIPFHPNLTDEIFVYDYPCKINKIHYDLDDLSDIYLYVEAKNNLMISIRNNPSNEKIHQWLSTQWKEMQGWYNSKGKTIILNDYFMNPEKPFDNRCFDE